MYLLKTKNEAVEKIKYYVKKMEIKWNMKAMIRCN